MSTSWDATDRLKPLWRTVGGRDALAKKAGISPPGTLSAYNSGKRPLGLKNAAKIAAALNVTLLDLGKPADADAPDDLLVLDRLAQLEAANETRRQETESLTQLVAELTARVERLEARESEERGTG